MFESNWEYVTTMVFHKYNNGYGLDKNLWNHFLVLCDNTNWGT